MLLFWTQPKPLSAKRHSSAASFGARSRNSPPVIEGLWRSIIIPHAIVASDLPNRVQAAWIAPAMPSSRCPLYRSCMGFVLEIAIMHLSKIKRISFKCFLHLCASSLAVFHPHITRSHPFAEPQSLSVSWEKSCFALIIACSYLFRKKLKFIIFL